jgi:methanogenic corrinoid protein MtbC1
MAEKFGALNLSEKELLRKALKTKISKNVRPRLLADLSFAVMEGNDDEAQRLGEIVLASDFPANRVLKSFYEGLKTAEELYRKGLSERSDLIMTVEAFVRGFRPMKEVLRKTLTQGSVLLGVMESDGQWAATAYTIPLLKEFGHAVHMVASYYPKFYLEKIKDMQPERPDVVCVTAANPGGRVFIKDILNSLRQIGLQDGVTYMACGTYLQRKDALSAGYDVYVKGYLEVPEIVNRILTRKKRDF